MRRIKQIISQINWSKHRKEVKKMIDKFIEEEMSKTYEGMTYLRFRQCNSQEMAELEKAVKRLISKNNLTVTQAKGFLEYMKISIEGSSYLQKEK
nr:MAG TPA: arginine decarboxylase [Caudoviricetes sp.]